MSTSLQDVSETTSNGDRGISGTPPGILREIFLYSLPDYDVEPFIRPGTSRVPLNLSLVCKDWRDLSIHCPHLWTRISICLPTLVGAQLKQAPLDIPELRKYYSQLEAGVQRWLDRSGSLPLSICYEEVEESHPNHELGESVRLRQIFISVASRWECVEIGWKGEDLLDLLSSETEMPYLRQLYLGSGMSSIEGPMDLSRLANLSLLSATGVTLYTPEEIILPHYLAYLYVDGVDLDGALTLLTRCPSLVSVRLLILDHTPSTFIERVVLPYVDRISITFSSVPSVTQFWDSLTLPMLNTLEVEWCSMEWGTTTVAARISSMIQRSRCNLEYLVIRRNFHDEDILKCLLLSPNLQILEFQDSQGLSALRGISTVLNRLTNVSRTLEGRSGRMLCPELYVLRIENRTPFNIYSDSLIDFLLRPSPVEAEGEAISQDTYFELQWKGSSPWRQRNTELFDTWRTYLEGSEALQQRIANGLHVHLTIDGSEYFCKPNNPLGFFQVV